MAVPAVLVLQRSCLCNALGMKTFATVGSDEKVAAISNITHAINYKTQDFEQVINEATG